MLSTNRLMTLALAAALEFALAASVQAGDERGQREHQAAVAASESDPHAAHKSAAAKHVTAQSVPVKLTDVELVNQDGKPVKLKSELIGDRIVVMDFIYTTCTTVCPVLSALLADVQGKIGKDMGRDVALVSMTVDPVRDTPQRLKAVAERHNAGPGWTFVTGRKSQVEDALRSFGAFTPNYIDHPPLVMVGDGRTGKWLRFFGFPSPDQLTAAVKDLQAARQGKSG